MTILLDTSVIIDALNSKRDRHNLVRELAFRGEALACCAINVAEVYAGMVGAKYGLQYAEEFQHIGPDKSLDEYVSRHAVRL